MDNETRINRAYQDVFGRDDATRSKNQKIVWADLKHRLYLERQCFIPSVEKAPDFNEKKLVPVSAKIDPYAAAVTDGMRGGMIYIKGRAESPLTNKADEV